MDAGSSLPTSGNTSGCALEIDLAGVWHLVQLGATVAGTATANGTTAIANADAVAAAADRLRLRTFAIHNIAGVYSLSAATQHDRRPWAKGAYYRVKRTSANFALTTTMTLLDSLAGGVAGQFQPRIECSGAPLRVAVKGMGSINMTAVAQYLQMELWVDGARHADSPATKPLIVSQQTTNAIDGSIDCGWTIIPTAGTHLVGIAARYSAGTSGTVQADATHPLVLEIEEILRDIGSNN
jgi:hypothetical protein